MSWVRETKPPLHRRPARPDPFGLRWVAEWVVQSWLERPRPPTVGPEYVELAMGLSYPPDQQDWLKAEMVRLCADRGRRVILTMPPSPPTPTPAEVLAASMPKLPALPPTAALPPLQRPQGV